MHTNRCHTCIHPNIQSSTHTYKQTYIHTYIHTYMHTHMHTHMHRNNKHTYIYMNNQFSKSPTLSHPYMADIIFGVVHCQHHPPPTCVPNRTARALLRTRTRSAVVVDIHLCSSRNSVICVKLVIATPRYRHIRVLGGRLIVKERVTNFVGAVRIVLRITVYEYTSL